YHIGAMSHYISDVGVFGHTMGSGTDWGSEAHHSDYESAFESLIGSLELPSGITLEDLPAYDATLGLAKDVTFGKGDIKPNVWMDSNYLWTNPEFEASALASLYASVEAVAAAINHLLREAFDVPELPEPPTTEEPKVFPPGVPVNLSATFYDNRIILAWSPPSTNGGTPITHYYIYRSEGQSDFSLLVIVNSSTVTWDDISVIEEKIYSYKLRARNAVGFSCYSEVVTIMTSSREDVSEGAPSVIYITLLSVTMALGIGGIVYRNRKQKNDNQ
ncbi:MAG: fibronectin type III domain-containing protein, partial [Thermoplasmata archaeon]